MTTRFPKIRVNISDQGGVCCITSFGNSQFVYFYGSESQCQQSGESAVHLTNFNFYFQYFSRFKILYRLLIWIEITEFNFNQFKNYLFINLFTHVYKFLFGIINKSPHICIPCKFGVHIVNLFWNGPLQIKKYRAIKYKCKPGYHVIIS